MRVFRLDDLSYDGRHEHAMDWDHPSGSQPYYWHPDWLHIAEDATGFHPKQPLDVEQDQSASKTHAVSAILKHINQWAADKLSSNPDIENQSIESEINLKK